MYFPIVFVFPISISSKFFSQICLFDRKAQEAAFEALNNELKEIREEFKAEGFFSVVVDFFCLSLLFCSFLFSVTENKESALEAQNQLREEILGKLEETNKSIDQVFSLN